jgi:hypothetical protein
MQWHHKMLPTLTTGNANIADYTANTSASNKNSSTFPPYFIKLIEEILIILNIAHLPFTVFLVLFERPIWR